MLTGEALPRFEDDGAVSALMRKVVFKLEAVTEKPWTDGHILQCLCWVICTADVTEQLNFGCFYF